MFYRFILNEARTEVITFTQDEAPSEYFEWWRLADTESIHQLRQTQLGEFLVSTILLPYPRNMIEVYVNSKAKPLMFETMIFKNGSKYEEPDDEMIYLSGGIQEALNVHEGVVKALQEKIK